MFHKQKMLLGLVFGSPLFALPLACSSGDQDAAIEKDLSAFTETVDVGDGVSLQFVYDAEHNMGSAVATGPASQSAKLEKLAAVKGGVAALYRAVRPGVALPARIEKLEAQILSSAKNAAAVKDELHLATDEAEALEESIEPLLTETSPTNKAVIVSPWQTSWCNDHTDSFQARQDWYQKFDWCYENVTNVANITRTTVRQAFVIMEMRTGSGTLRARYKDSTSAAWITHGTWPIPQGTNRWVRNWATSNTPIDVRYDVLDTVGKTYHIAVQTAETPVSSMAGNAAPKAVGSNDYYRVACACNNGIVATAQQCISNPTGTDANGNAFPTWNGAQWTCGVVCSNDAGGGAIGMERRTIGAACSNNIAPLICTVNNVKINNCK